MVLRISSSKPISASCVSVLARPNPTQAWYGGTSGARLRGYKNSLRQDLIATRLECDKTCSDKTPGLAATRFIATDLRRSGQTGGEDRCRRFAGKMRFDKMGSRSCARRERVLRLAKQPPEHIQEA